MIRLPDSWISHLDSGVSCRIATCAADGTPQMRRALAVRLLGDGRLELLVPRATAAAALEALRHNGRVALTVSQPQSYRTLHVKGRDADMVPADASHQAFLEAQRDAFADALTVFGFSRETIRRNWFDLAWPDLDCVRFRPYGAWDQTPGIGAGGPIDLIDVGRIEPVEPGPADRTDDPGDRSADRASDRTTDRAAVRSTAREAARLLTLREVRRLLEGVIPPSMATVSADGVPHANFLSHVEYVDASHVALTYQFFNRSRANVMATGRASLMIECPHSGACVVLQLRYVRTEDAGPVFERMRAQLAGIAAHTGMEKVFRLLGADIYAVESVTRHDTHDRPAGVEPRCDVAEGARALASRLADVSELPRLVPEFMDGLGSLLRIDHAILWLLDEGREGLYTLASLGYADSGVGSELALSDAGLAAVAIREGVPIRIGHMASKYRYGLTWRARAEGVGLQAVIARAIPLPGLADPRSQLAVPLRARGRTVGALLVESDAGQPVFSHDDEDALMLLGAQLAQAMAALQLSEIQAGLPAPSSAAGGPTPAGGPALTLRHWPRDHTVFADDDYLIKGVAGAILWRLATEQVQRGRREFTTRELRLAGGDLGLPEVQDNLGVRLLLLERRLAERACGLAIERAGRGRFRFVAERPLQLREEADT